MFRKALIAFSLMLVSGVLFLVENFGVLLMNPAHADGLYYTHRVEVSS
ncbi:MAG: hypothetical protein OXU51_13840 [Candidatus Poribacteria bacterium]|nr:hypothetical protein [Candidatus Poribacteria bacterium]